MRIYTAPGVSAYTVDGAHIETFITLAVGSYSTVVEAWDNCGGVAKKTVDITVNSDAGLSVFLPSSSSIGIPVHVAASAQNPDCSGGISSIRIYTASGMAPYTIDSDQLNAFVNLLPGTYDLTVQAWDNCGHVYKAPLTETATGAADGYLYATASDAVAEFTIKNGALTNPNGSSNNPPTFPAASDAYSIAVDPGNWFVYVPTASGIYGYQIDQSNGNLWNVPGSPFPLNGSGAADLVVDPNGNFLFVSYNSSTSVGEYQINRSSGALTATASETISGGIFAVTTDFTGQYVYADNYNSSEAEVWGWAINPNNGALAAVPGSPSTLPSGDSYGEAMTTTMLPSGSPASPVLYVVSAGSEVVSYMVNFGTGALSGTAGNDSNGCQYCVNILADNQARWVWAISPEPMVELPPPQNWFDLLTIASQGSGSGFAVEGNTYTENLFSIAEDGSGLYLYGGGENSNSNGGVVTSWKVNDDGDPTALTGPLNTGSTASANLAVAVKHGD
jgi:hypothetical protein